MKKRERQLSPWFRKKMDEDPEFADLINCHLEPPGTKKARQWRLEKLQEDVLLKQKAWLDMQIHEGLNQSEVDIYISLKGKMLKVPELARESGYDAKTVEKALRRGGRLRKRGLVLNRRGQGYYRPDEPPPEL